MKKEVNTYDIPEKRLEILQTLGVADVKVVFHDTLENNGIAQLSARRSLRVSAREAVAIVLMPFFPQSANLMRENTAHLETGDEVGTIYAINYPQKPDTDLSPTGFALLVFSHVMAGDGPINTLSLGRKGIDHYLPSLSDEHRKLVIDTVEPYYVGLEIDPERGSYTFPKELRKLLTSFLDNPHHNVTWPLAGELATESNNGIVENPHSGALWMALQNGYRMRGLAIEKDDNRNLTRIHVLPLPRPSDFELLEKTNDAKKAFLRLLSTLDMQLIARYLPQQQRGEYSLFSDAGLERQIEITQSAIWEEPVARKLR